MLETTSLRKTSSAKGRLPRVREICCEVSDVCECGYTGGMATQRYAYQIECPECGVSGTAYGSDDDNGPHFAIDELSAGFRSNGSRNPWAVRFWHACGAEAPSNMTIV